MFLSKSPSSNNNYASSKVLMQQQSIRGKPPKGKPTHTPVKPRSILITLHKNVQIMSWEEEVALMAKAEQEQTSSDKFWGIDKQDKNVNEERSRMIAEDERSFGLEAYYKKIQIVQLWEKFDYEYRMEEARAMAIEEEYARKKYLELLNNVTNSMHIIQYQWPTKPHVVPESQESKPVTLDNAADTFALRQFTEKQATIHFDGLQKTRVLADSFAAAITTRNKSNNKQSLSGSGSSSGGLPDDRHKFALMPLVSRSASPLLQHALNSSNGMFDRPTSPLAQLLGSITRPESPADIPDTNGRNDRQTYSQPRKNLDVAPPNVQSRRVGHLFHSERLRKLSEGSIYVY